MKILITGGAGFVGASLAKNFLKKNPSAKITCMDNLYRKGSELNVPELQKLGITFIKGDVRFKKDFENLPGPYDLIIEASAEPSVHAGVDSSPEYLIDTNLFGLINCLEYSRKNCGLFIFLSTSRVYSLDNLVNIPLKETPSRLVLNLSDKIFLGLSEKGISEEFATNSSRSLYGTTKLAGEMFIQEYANIYGIKAFINRCGVLCGEGQWGKTDQGIFTLWVARHFFEKKLSYTGFGGKGLQIRDLLHPEDLFSLLEKQISTSNKLTSNPPIYNIGGGLKQAVSLFEYTELCRAITGKNIEIACVPQTAPMDVPYYVTDYSKAEKDFTWTPTISPSEIVTRINHWIKENASLLKNLF